MGIRSSKPTAFLVLLVGIAGILVLAGSQTVSAKRPKNFKLAFRAGLPVAVDPEYGRIESRPIKVGDLITSNPDRSALRNRTHHLLSLRGANGEPVHYRRLGSCCGYEDPKVRSALAQATGDYFAVLDKFEVWYEGLDQPVLLYFDIHRFDSPMIPVGFTFVSTPENDWNRWIHER